MKAVYQNLLQLSWQNQRVDKDQFVTLTFGSKKYRYRPLTILHLRVISVRRKLLKLSCENQSVDKFQSWPWPFDPKMSRYLPFTILNMKAIRWKPLKLLCQSQSVDKVQSWPWPLDPKMYFFPSKHLASMYGMSTLKTTQVVVSEPKCWQSSVVTWTFDLLTPKCIGVFL